MARGLSDFDVERIASEVRKQIQGVPVTFRPPTNEELTEIELENKGLRKSLEAALKGEDGLTEVFREERTDKGTREICLRLAGLTHHVLVEYQDFTPDDVVTTAKLFEDYINGVQAPREQS